MAKVIRFPVERIKQKKIINLRLDQMLPSQKKGFVVKDEVLQKALSVIADKSIPIDKALEIIKSVYMTH